MKRIGITGGNGFIGNYLCNSLKSSNRKIKGFVRNLNENMNCSEIEYISIGDLSSEINWKEHIYGLDCIVHCAGKVHEINTKNNLDTFRLINTEATRHLAEQASAAGVKRLVFLSSIKVNGESTGKKNEAKLFTNYDIPNPKGAYSVSKFEAEQILWEISGKTDLEVVVVRLPLVYGYGVKGNLERLMKLINFGLPLPFSLIKNKRSLIGIDNLIDLLLCFIEHPQASGKTFLVSDCEDLSTPDLLKHIASAMGRSPRLFPFPIFLLQFFGFLTGKSSEIKRLTGSLKVESDYTKKEIGWSAPVSVEEGIRRMVRGV